MATDPPGRQPIPPEKRRRLQQCFESASRSAGQGQWDYAISMFDVCVKGDPANQIYIKQYLTTLGKRYNDNKKGAGITSAPKIKVLQGVVKKASMSKDNSGVLDKGWDVLKLNPWETWTLSAMAEAASELHFDEAQFTYLKQALDVDPKNADINRKCGKALASLGHFDQAINCWQRVLAAKPGDHEALRAVADLQVERTIHKGKYEDAESGQDVRADKHDRASEADSKLTPVQKLEKQISKKPEDVGLYIELSELHTREERFKDAEEVLKKALEVSGGDLSIRERLEDATLRTLRQNVEIARKKYHAEKTQEAKDLYQKMKAELNLAEMESYRGRCERYPTNLRHKYELGVRLKIAGQFHEAIKQFQAALGDPKLKPKAHLELGECFQSIKQYKLAMQNFEQSVEGTVDRDVEDRKLALYRAGYLSLGLAQKYVGAGDSQAAEEIRRAEKHLNELASLDFGYKDVAQLLDKLAQLLDKLAKIGDKG